VIETHAMRGQTIDVRGLDDRVAVATQRRTQIVGDDEEDVVLWLLRRGN